MQKIFSISTDTREALYDITRYAKEFIASSNTKTGLLNLYVRGATAAIMIQENWDQSVQQDVLSFLKKYIPKGVWEHDKQDNNGDAHLKAGLVGPSETIPVINSTLGLSQWQNIFLCEFDGPRKTREIVLTLLSNREKN